MVDFKERLSMVRRQLFSLRAEVALALRRNALRVVRRRPSNAHSGPERSGQHHVSLHLKNALCNTAGFGLVETAIVLMILGIMISLGFKGYHLVDTARLRAVAAQIQQIQTAVLAYQDRFHQWPGDGQSVGGKTQSGNQNGIIEGNGFSSKDEAGQFWLHLSQAGFLPAMGANSLDTLSFGHGLPSARIGGGWIVTHEPESMPGHWLVLGLAQGETKNLPTPSLTPDMAQTLDQQLDDGLPESGSVRASGEGCLKDKAYVLGLKTKVCRLFVEL